MEKNNNIEEDYDYLGNSASTCDCTGLQYKAPVDEHEKDSYDDVYHYLPPKVKIKEDAEK